ncbi:unnamed protein product, partial [Staurois parvus]
LKHNTVQTNHQHPQITVHTTSVQAGRVNINWAGRYRGSKRRIRGHRPGSEVASKHSTGVRQRDSRVQARDQNR